MFLFWAIYFYHSTLDILVILIQTVTYLQTYGSEIHGAVPNNKILILHMSYRVDG